MRRLALQSVRLAALVYLTAALLCTQLPLLNYLGYEFSVVIALLATFIAGFSTIKSIKHLLHEKPHDQSPISGFFSAFKHSLSINLLLLLIPLAIISLNAFFVKNCSWLEGLGFYLLIPVVTVLFAASLGLFCAAHYRRSKTVFTFFFLATIGYTVSLGYITPAIFSYNFFYGYFPGLTYDEALGISTSLVVYRIFTLITAGALVWMSWLILTRANISDGTWRKGLALAAALVERKAVFITAALATLLIVAWWFRGELGFESTSAFIRRELGGRAETEHFIIFYSKNSYDDEEIRWIAAEHEFRLKQVADAFALPPISGERSHKIESYIYPSSDVKQQLMGAGNTNIAKPWSGQIHISRQSLDATLKHELVHVLAAQFGLPIIKASLSTGLVEGLAEAIDWNFGNRTLHQYAAAMNTANVAPDIRSLMLFTGFASQSSSISYVLAGSFCRYLMDTYGMRKLTLLYRTNDYHTVYNKSLDELIGEWKKFLAAIPVLETDLAAVDVFFRRQPIFKKVCARVVAARNIEARRLLADKMYSEARQLFAESYAETKSYEALSGMLAGSLRLRQFDALESALDTIIMRDAKPNQFLPLLLNIGDALWAKGKTIEAQSLYRKLADANVSEGLTDAALLRWHAVRDSSNRATFLEYFLADRSDTLRLRFLDSSFAERSNGVAAFLQARVLQRLNRHGDASQALRSFTFEPTDSTLEASRLKTLGYSLFRLKEFEQAKSAFWQSLNFVATDVAKNRVNDWVERCAWMKGNLQ